jgi:ABC-type polysaccharide/polyol phosphate export permease
VINRNLVTKIYFAREVLPFSAILTAGFDFLIASIVLAGMMIWFKVAPAPTIALVPLVLLIQVIFSAGVVLALSMINLFYRDVGQVVNVMMMAWMFVTAVVYSIPNTGGWRVLNTLNPMTPIIVSYRDLILRGVPPDWGSLGLAALISVAFFAGAWVVFHRSEFRFAENV